MVIGKCHLCHELKALQASHVHPQFIYKRYISDQKHGGQFVDLAERKFDHHQTRRSWLCGGKDGCEEILSKTEDYAARLFDRMEKNPRDPVEYGERFLRFAVSIVWRTMKHYYEELPYQTVARRWDAYSRWKRFLRGTRAGIAPFTLHAYLITEVENGFSRMVGGKVYEDQSLVFCIVGPLIVIGLLAPEKLSAHDLRIWKNVQIRREGGVIDPLTGWKTGRGKPELYNVTIEFAQLMYAQERWIVERCQAVVKK